MRVSAVIPTYNRRRYIGRAIESILSQRLPVDELIVVDDGSTDGTSDFIEHRFGKQVRVVRQENQGVSGARRRALQEANGDWVAFLDSDDEWTPDRNRVLTTAAGILPPEVAWIFGNLQLVRDEGGEESTFQKFGLQLPKSPYMFDDPIALQYPFQFGMLQASLVRLSALREIDAFATHLDHSEDFLVGVQVACRYKYAAVDALVGRLYRTSDLKATSLDTAGRHSVDYYRARLIGYSQIIQSGKSGPWGERYAEVVRGLCKVTADRGGRIKKLALEQFRFGISAKSIAFQFAAMFGQTGLALWKRLGKASRGEPSLAKVERQAISSQRANTY